MLALLRQCLGVFVALSVITGAAYPALVTLVAQGAFPHQANGSVVERGGRPVGSELIGQPFSGPGYFWSRPSATTPQPYNGAASAGSNQATTNPVLLATVAVRLDALRAADPGNRQPVPIDLVTASGSGLDPHISPAAAEYQLARVARSRGMMPERVRSLVQAHTEGRTLGLFGEPRVNVLALNLSLEAASSRD
jgi:K+-transporting ATPase ATPase C chain